MYVSVSELKAEGVDPDVTNSRINSSILLAQSYIDKMTRQWFEPREMTVLLDGGRTVFFLPLFCISLSEVKIDDELLTADDYYLYNRYYPDDRMNPKIRFARKTTKGFQNISLKGYFGYVESDSSTPLDIKKICKKMALVETKQMSDSERRDLIDRGRIIEEETDGHRYKLEAINSTNEFTGDAEIDSILRAYRAPIGIGLA
jgi:hypothetical protein